VLNKRLRADDSKFKSEQIIAQLLREIFIEVPYQSLLFHREISLNQLLLLKNNSFTIAETNYIKNGARCDFVIYFKTGKNPLGVIEVDGSKHDKSPQKELDILKNSILAKAGLPLLRLKTIESHVKDKIRFFLNKSFYQEASV